MLYYYIRITSIFFILLYCACFIVLYCMFDAAESNLNATYYSSLYNSDCEVFMYTTAVMSSYVEKESVKFLAEKQSDSRFYIIKTYSSSIPFKI